MAIRLKLGGEHTKIDGSLTSTLLLGYLWVIFLALIPLSCRYLWQQTSPSASQLTSAEHRNVCTFRAAPFILCYAASAVCAYVLRYACMHTLKKSS